MLDNALLGWSWTGSIEEKRVRGIRVRVFARSGGSVYSWDMRRLCVVVVVGSMFRDISTSERALSAACFLFVGGRRSRVFWFSNPHDATISQPVALHTVYCPWPLTRLPPQFFGSPSPTPFSSDRASKGSGSSFGIGGQYESANCAYCALVPH